VTRCGFNELAPVAIFPDSVFWEKAPAEILAGPLVLLQRFTTRRPQKALGAKTAKIEIGAHGKSLIRR